MAGLTYLYGVHWDVLFGVMGEGESKRFSLEVKAVHKKKPMPEYIAREELEFSGYPEWAEVAGLQNEFYEQHPDVERIGLPLDGEKFTFSTARGALKQVEHLKGLGYRVPAHLINRLTREAEEEVDV